MGMHHTGPMAANPPMPPSSRFSTASTIVGELVFLLLFPSVATAQNDISFLPALCGNPPIEGMPGVAVNRDTLGHASIGDSGHVVAQVSLSGVTGDSRAIVRADPDGMVHLIARWKEVVTVPGVGAVTFDALVNLPVVDANGNVAVFAEVSGLPQDPVANADRIVLFGQPGALQPFAFEGEQVTTGFGDGHISTIHSAYLTPGGQVFVSASHLGVPGHSGHTAVYSGGGAAKSILFEADQNYPGLPAGTSFNSIGLAGASNDGQVALEGTLNIGEGGVTNADADLVCVGSAGAVSVVARRGSEAPGVGDGTFNVPSVASFSDGGWICIRSLIQGAQSPENIALWIGQPGNLQLMVRGGDTPPGGTGTVFPAPQNVAVAANGQAVFGAILTSGDHGIWRWDGGGLSLVALMGTGGVPGFLGDTWNFLGQLNNRFDIRSLAISPTGRIFFSAHLNSSVGPRATWGTDEAGGLSLIAKGGDALDLGGGEQVTAASPFPVLERDFPSNVVSRISNGGGDGLQTFVNSRNEVLLKFRTSGCLAVVDTGATPQARRGDINGRVLIDPDGDGDPADATSGLAGVTVQVIDLETRQPAAPAKITDANGGFTFPDLEEGEYAVTADLGAGESSLVDQGFEWTGEFAADGSRYARAVPSEQIEEVRAPRDGSNFAWGAIILTATREGAIRGTVRDADQPNFGVPGAQISLRNLDGTSVEGTRTIVTHDGTFEFNNVKPGNYFLEEIDPPGYVSVRDSGQPEDPNDPNRIEIHVTSGATSAGHEFFDRIPPFSVSLHTLATEGIVNPNRPPSSGKLPDIVPIFPVKSAALLEKQPSVSDGLVADGVTPLLIKFAASGLQGQTTLRWQCESISGTVNSGIYPHMKRLVTGEWLDLNDAESRQATLTPEQPFAFVCIEALKPEWLPSDSSEVKLLFSLLDTSNNPLATKEITLRRPPVALIALYSFAGPWGPELLGELGAGFHPDFVFPLDLGKAPLADLKSVGDILKVLPPGDLNRRWALTRLDLVVHGQAILWARQALRRRDFRADSNHYRGAIRRLIVIGAPNNGSRLAPYLEQIDSDLLPRDPGGPLFSFLPFMSLRISSWDALHKGQLDPRGKGFKLKPEFDTSTRVHHVVTIIDPESSAGFRFVGLLKQRKPGVLSTINAEIVFPLGSDGVVDVESMVIAVNGKETRPAELEFKDSLKISLLISLEDDPPQDLRIAHGPPPLMFGSAKPQTSSSRVGKVIRDGLETPESETWFGPYVNPEPKSESDIREIIIAAGDVPAADVVNIAPAAIAAAGARVKRDGHDNPSTTRQFDFELDIPPTQPITGRVFWFVELHGVGGVSLDGVSVIKDPTNPAVATVLVDHFAVGDAVLFASYETIGGKIAFARPVLVASQAPLGSALERIELLPDGITLPLGETIRPDVVAVYDDGTRITKWVTRPDITSVTSSAPTVLSVADEPNWNALSAGTAIVTINAFGMSDQATVTIEAPPPSLTYAQWRAEVFSAAHLADPSISGDGSDVDGDQLSTFFEYITGGSPFVPESGHLPEPTEILVDDEMRRAVSIRISTRVLGETIVVQRSSDLQAWENLLNFSTEPDLSEEAVLDYIDGGSYLRIFFDADTNDTTFFRLAVNPSP